MNVSVLLLFLLTSSTNTSQVEPPKPGKDTLKYNEIMGVIDCVSVILQLASTNINSI
jgi:hypothetical protein